MKKAIIHMEKAILRLNYLQKKHRVRLLILKN